MSWTALFLLPHSTVTPLSSLDPSHGFLPAASVSILQEGRESEFGAGKSSSRPHLTAD